MESFGFVPSSESERQRMLSLASDSKEAFAKQAMERGKQIQEEYERRKLFKPKDSDLLLVQFSPIVTLLFASSKLRVNYSTVFLKKLKDLSNGTMVALVKYITSQSTPFSISTVKMASKLLRLSENRTQWSKQDIKAYERFMKTLKEFKDKLEKFNITYDHENFMLHYNTPVKGVGFSTSPNPSMKLYPNQSLTTEEKKKDNSGE